MSRNLLLVSSSKCHPHGYLDHCADQAATLFAGIDEIIFVPYARPGGATHDEYTAIARDRFSKMDIAVRGLHEFESPAAAVGEAKGVFIGGGNTFVLLNQLYAGRCYRTHARPHGEWNALHGHVRWFECGRAFDRNIK